MRLLRAAIGAGGNRERWGLGGRWQHVQASTLGRIGKNEKIYRDFVQKTVCQVSKCQSVAAGMTASGIRKQNNVQ